MAIVMMGINNPVKYVENSSPTRGHISSNHIRSMIGELTLIQGVSQYSSSTAAHSPIEIRY